MATLPRRRLLKGALAMSVLPVGRSHGATDFRSDMAVLREAMEIHPGALRYLNPAALDAALDLCALQLEGAQTLRERYLVLSEFLAKLRCGHTYANFFNQSKAVQRELFTGTTRLPFTFRWLDDAMVITDALDKQALPRGTRVSAINGVGPEEIFQRLLPYTRADGAAPGKRRALLEVQHRGNIEFFDVFHGLVYGSPPDGKFSIEGVDASGKAIGARVPAIDLKQRIAMREAAMGNLGPTDPMWQWRVDDQVGVLTMNNWALYKTRWDWQPWLEARLDEARSLKGLIIDLRANEGGDPIVGAVLLSRLIREAVPIPPMRRLVRFRSLPESLRGHTNTWDSSFYDMGVNATPVARGFYELPPDGMPSQLEPRGEPVDVPVAVLISPSNSSASFTFARVAKSTGRVTLVGQTTGGNRRGINGDAYFFMTLPHSGVELDIPIVGSFPPEPQPDAGIEPHVAVTESQVHIAEGRDATLAGAKELF